MKFKAFLPIFLSVVVIGCSSEETGTTLPTNKNYFPLTTGNSWTYNNVQQINEESPIKSQETMTIVNSAEKNGTTYYDLNSDKRLAGGGLATSIFSNGKLSKINGQLIYSGNFKIHIRGLEPIKFPIEGAVVYNSSAAAGTELTHFSHSLEQDIRLNGQTIPVTLNYTVSTLNKAFLPTFSAGGKEFEDVLQANLSITVSATVDYIIPMTILSEQNVVTIENYYADGVGLIYSNATLQYEFEDFTALGFPKFPNLYVKTSQEIAADTYRISGVQ